MFFKAFYGNWLFSMLKLWDVQKCMLDYVMIFLGFGPWASFLSVGVFEFRPKFFLIFIMVYTSIKNSLKIIFLMDRSILYMKKVN